MFITMDEYIILNISASVRGTKIHWHLKQINSPQTAKLKQHSAGRRLLLISTLLLIACLVSTCVYHLESRVMFIALDSKSKDCLL